MLRQVLVVPGAEDQILEGSGVRCYRLHGPPIPTQKPYRFMLATESTSRIVAHERPDLIEVGSAWCAPWLIRLATRRSMCPRSGSTTATFPASSRLAPGRPDGCAAAPVPPRGGMSAVSAAWSTPPSLHPRPLSGSSRTRGWRT